MLEGLILAGVALWLTLAVRPAAGTGAAAEATVPAAAGAAVPEPWLGRACTCPQIRWILLIRHRFSFRFFCNFVTILPCAVVDFPWLNR